MYSLDNTEYEIKFPIKECPSCGSTEMFVQSVQGYVFYYCEYCRNRYMRIYGDRVCLLRPGTFVPFTGGWNTNLKKFNENFGY